MSQVSLKNGFSFEKDDSHWKEYEWLSQEGYDENISNKTQKALELTVGLSQDKY